MRCSLQGAAVSISDVLGEMVNSKQIQLQNLERLLCSHLNSLAAKLIGQASNAESTLVRGNTGKKGGKVREEQRTVTFSSAELIDPGT